MDFNDLLQGVLAACVPVLMLWVRSYLKNKTENEFVHMFIDQLADATQSAVKTTESLKSGAKGAAKKAAAKMKIVTAVGEKALKKAEKHIGPTAVQELVEDHIEAAVFDLKKTPEKKTEA